MFRLATRSWPAWPRSWWSTPSCSSSSHPSWWASTSSSALYLIDLKKLFKSQLYTEIGHMIIWTNLNILRSLVSRRSQSEEAVRAVWVSPDKRFDHKLCHRHRHRHHHSHHHRHCRHRHHHHPHHHHHQDCPGVTSLIASTVFSFVDRESCLEETDPVISQLIIHLGIVTSSPYKNHRFWRSTRSTNKSWTWTDSLQAPLMSPLMTIKCLCDDSSTSKFCSLCCSYN